MATGHHRLRRSAIAKLVSLYHPRELPLGPNQLPLPVDETLAMVVEFSLPDCEAVDVISPKLKELSLFFSKYNLFTPEELSCVLMANEMDLYNLLSRSIPCVGCRRSIEQLYGQLIDLGVPALDPVVISSDGFISLSPNYISKPKLLFSLFDTCGSKLNRFIDSIPKVKKSRRCLMHSLDGQKLQPLGSWLEIWDQMEQECREEVVVIEQEILLDALQSHLKKHRFCNECKSKVILAYDLLVLNADPDNEKEYDANVYDGIRYCSEEKHIHVVNSTDFVARLMRRAEPEVRGSRREKHAKTIDIAQEEILICIGICLYDRLHRISQRVREEGQTWQSLLLLCVECLRTNFEIDVEKKQGYSQLDLLCMEISMEQEQRECKQKKRKSRKSRVQAALNRQCPDCMCAMDQRCKVCKDYRGRSQSPQSVREVHPNVKVSKSPASSTPSPPVSPSLRMSPGCSCDCTESGYSSGSANDASWNLPNSCNSSETTCSESCCAHDEDGRAKENKKPAPVVAQRLASQHRSVRKGDKHANADIDVALPVLSLLNAPPSLEDMLRLSRPSEEESYIPPDELQEMKVRLRQSTQERLKFRETLKRRFADLQRLSKFRFRPVVFRQTQTTD